MGKEYQSHLQDIKKLNKRAPVISKLDNFKGRIPPAAPITITKYNEVGSIISVQKVKAIQKETLITIRPGLVKLS